MRILLQPLVAVLCIAITTVSCKKSHEDPIPADPDNAVETKPPVQTAVTANVTANIQGYYSSVPYYYQYTTTKRYPLIVFISGGGQYGNGASDLPLLLDDGMAKLINDKKFPANFVVDGKNYSFIVLSPQAKGYPSPQDISDFIAYAKTHYRIDESRIYLSGISNGGESTGDVAAAYPSQIAAIVPISGESRNQISCAVIAKNKVAVWDFHNSNDPLVNVSQSNEFIGWINSNSPMIAPKQTIFQASIHDAWTKALDPSYKENGMNIYEWMLLYAK